MKRLDQADRARGHPAPVQRSRGRPRLNAPGSANEAALTVGREGLLDATIALMHQLPPARLTSSALAREVGVHPSLIRYYFGERTGLLVAVAERIVERMSARLKTTCERCQGSPREALRTRIAALIDLNAEFPFFHELIVTELANSQDPDAHALIARLTRRGCEAYSEILGRGSLDKAFRPLDAQLLYVVAIAVSEFFEPARRQFEISQGQSIDAGALRETYKTFVCDLILHGVLDRPAARAAN